MSDMFEEDEEIETLDPLYSLEPFDSNDDITIDENLFDQESTRRRLENLLEERRLRKELEDFMDM